MGTQASIAEQIQAQEADYVLAVKDNQGLLSESIREFFEAFVADPQSTPHSVQETVEKDYGRLERHRCYAFSQLECLVKPEQWPNASSSWWNPLRKSERRPPPPESATSVRWKPMPEPLLQAIRSHWSVEISYTGVWMGLADDQMRLREGYAANNPGVLKHVALNLIRQGPVFGKASIESKRLLAATSDRYRAQLIGVQT